jgi:chromosome segregation ATPase
LTQLLDERQNDGKVEALTAQIGTLRTERDTARDQMEQHRAHAAALRNERDQVSGEIIGLRAAIAQREKDLAEATNLAEQHKAHAAALRTERDREMGDSAALRAALSELQSNEANLRAHLEQITAEHAAALGKAALEVTNLRLAAGEHDTSLKLLRADRDTSVAEYKAIRAERDAALRDFREAGELLEIADHEIAALSQETQTYAGLLALADSDARAAAAKLGSAGMLANQLYDEIRALYELRAIANAEVAEARTALKRDTASLAAEVERLDEETRTLRLKLVNRARAHDRLESETRDILAELERERDAEREARIAGDELHDSLRVAVTVAREELRMANATIERLSDNTATAEEIETANLLIARLEEEREAQYAARIVSEEQHANLSAALIDARHQANDLKDRLTALERRMVEQTQMMLDQTRADSERTAVLIETVQTSIFWKIKRAVGRMTGRG